MSETGVDRGETFTFYDVGIVLGLSVVYVTPHTVMYYILVCNKSL